jgi:hypothetical protein
VAQPFPGAAPPAPPDAPKAPRLWPWITLLVAGALLAFAGLVTFVVTGVVALVNLPVQHDSVFAIPCSTGDYLIYAPSGRDVRTATSTTTSTGTSAPSTSRATTRGIVVSVTGPSGGAVGTYAPAETMTLTRDGFECPQRWGASSSGRP